MGFWNDGGFFSSVKGHVFKWWRLTIMPILHINNNSRHTQYVTSQPNTLDEQQSTQLHMNAEPQMIYENNVREEGSAAQNVSVSEMKEEVLKEQNTPETEDAMEVLRRINEEKEEKRRKEIETARQKASEEARIAAIMNANKVDVNAFIEAGRVAKEEIATKKAEEQAKLKADEDMRRAQEIMDRLNREAAEDDAKKLAEIEAAKEEARKQFG